METYKYIYIFVSMDPLIKRIFLLYSIINNNNNNNKSI